MDRTCLAKVITIGRKSGREHKVVLRLVNYNNKYYASRRDLNSDWIKNILANKEAKIVIDNIIIRCAAKMLDDESARVISS
ncbi:MAG: nitroreductase/quinone reductase family protein, partial [Candidatus Nitrosocaldaceae archaeon]